MVFAAGAEQFPLLTEGKLTKSFRGCTKFDPFELWPRPPAAEWNRRMEADRRRPLFTADRVHLPRGVFEAVMEAPSLTGLEKTTLLGLLVQAWTGARPDLSRNTLRRYRLTLTDLGMEELLRDVPGLRPYRRPEPPALLEGEIEDPADVAAMVLEDLRGWD